MTIDERELSAEFSNLANLKLIGEGGQKFVYCGNAAGGQALVLKLIKEPKQADARLEREILAVKEVSSARVPAIYDTGTCQMPDSNTYVWVQEQYIEGQSLREHLRHNGTLADEELARLGNQLFEALVDVDNARIVHRDIKPENIIVDSQDDFWLIDFGLLSRHLDLDSLTATNQGMQFGGVGTFGYCPPEQFRNQKAQIDIRTDLFAVGVTLWECATGKSPFRGHARDGQDLVRRIEGHVLPDFSTSFPTKVEGHLKAFLETLLQPRQAHRPQSVTKAWDWFQEFCPPPES